MPNLNHYRTICAADWGASTAKRSAYAADVETRRITPLDGGPWTLPSLVEAAMRKPGPVLLAIDAVLGLPSVHFRAARTAVPAWRGVETFLDWLRLAHATPGTFDPVGTAAAWSPARPFFRVPKGRGSLTAYWTAAGGRLFRGFEETLGAKPMFAVSGIPGTVGSGTRALFLDLAPLLSRDDRAFGVWPFEGNLEELAARHHVVVAEMYPRISYALSVADVVPAPLLRVAKTKDAPRAAHVAKVAAAAWVREQRVVLGDLAAPIADEDAFDAWVSAGALLRCVLEGHDLEAQNLDAAVEGSMLAIGLVA